MWIYNQMLKLIRIKSLRVQVRSFNVWIYSCESAVCEQLRGKNKTLSSSGATYENTVVSLVYTHVNSSQTQPFLLGMPKQYTYKSLQKESQVPAMSA